MLRRVTDYLIGFLPACQPYMTRQAYRYELVTSMSLPIAVSMVEGAVTGVLAVKLFSANELQFAMLTAAPFFANLTSYFWAVMSRGVRKVPFITALQLSLLACVAAVGLLPATPAGGWMLVGLVILARCLVSGVLTVRSAVWRLNYARTVRAQVTGRLVVLMSLSVAMAPLLTYAVLDNDPAMYRLIYPGAAMAGLVGVVAFTRVRVRREKELLASEMAPSAEPTPHGEPGAPVYEYDPQNRKDNFWTVLKRDHDYRAYQLWQFVLGAANMGAEVAIIYFIAQYTQDQPYEYRVSILLGTAVPMLVALVVLPIWAKYLDRVHIAEFRTRHSLVFVGCQVLNALAVGVLLSGWGESWVNELNAGGAWLGLGLGLWLAYCLLALPRVLQGFARGGGMLAWNLGHHDFADRRLVSIYMGIHVTLTGLRGMVAPFLGVLLLTGWGGGTWQGMTWPSWGGLGPGVFLISAAATFTAWLGYVRLNRRIQARGQALGSND